MHSMWVSNCSTGMHYGVDYEILCAVDGTFVLLSCFRPLPLCQTSQETPLLQVRCIKRHPLHLNMYVTLTPKTSRRMHERRPMQGRTGCGRVTQVNSYTAELRIALEKWFQHFSKKFYGPFHWTSLRSDLAIRETDPCVEHVFVRGPGYLPRLKATIRTPTVHANLGPWVPGSQVLWVHWI